MLKAEWFSAAVSACDSPGARRIEPEGELARVKTRGFEVLLARCEQEAMTGEDVLARATAYWSLAHGLAVLFLDGLARDRMTGSDEDIIRRVAAAAQQHVRQARSAAAQSDIA